MITIYNIYGEYRIDLMLSKVVINGMFLGNSSIYHKERNWPQATAEEAFLNAGGYENNVYLKSDQTCEVEAKLKEVSSGLRSHKICKIFRIRVFKFKCNQKQQKPLQLISHEVYLVFFIIV